MKRIAVVILVAAMSVPAAAQFSEFVEVRVTNVDAIVTDKDGKPVPGLTQSDFEIYEDGVKMEISNFLEVFDDPSGTLTEVPEGTATAPPPPAPQDPRRRHFVIFVDNAVLNPLLRNAVLEQMQKFLDVHVRPGDEVSLISWGRSLQVALDPTSNHTAIDLAMKRLAKHTAFESEGPRERENYQRRIAELITVYAANSQVENPEPPPLMLAIYEARGYAMWLLDRERRRIEALKAVMASMRGAAGRKILVVLTQSLSLTPAQDAFVYVDSIRDQFVADGSQPLQEAKEFELPSIITELSQAANSAGITLYGIDGSGRDGMLEMHDASTYVRVPAFGSGHVQNATFPVLSALAADTGGVAVVGSTNWKLAFDAIAADLNTYYSLGYKASGEKQDRLKKIEVRLKNKRYQVRSRRALIEPSLTTEMNDTVSAHLFRSVARNDLAIRAAAGSASVSSDSALIPVTIQIPTEKLTLLPEGGDLTGSVSLFTAFLLRDGRVSKVARQTKTFRFPAESLPRRKIITVKLDVTTGSNTAGISVGVMDDPSRSTGFASLKVY